MNNFSLKMQNLIQFLKTIEFLKTLPIAYIEKIASQCEMTHLHGGETLMHQGDEGNCLYIVQSGFLRAIKKQPGQDDVILSDIRRGELIGELALFTSAPRAATVIALRDSVLWKLSKASFDLFIQENPAQIMPMVKSVILRILHPPKPNKRPYVTLAIAPASEYELDTNEIRTIAEQFAATHKSQPGTSIDPLAVVLHIHPEMIKAQFPNINWQDVTPETLFNSDVIDWLSEQEEKYQYIIYETDATYSPWTALCLRQADKIILLAESCNSATLGVIEQHIFHSSRKKTSPVDLILLHDQNTVMPHDTARWLEERPVEVHHVRKGVLKDIQRVVRLMTGQGIVLVLGGGGAKGIAHLGVYKAFCELGVPIDRVCGTSLGSIAGAFIAMDMPLDQIIERVNKYVIHNKKLNDYTLPTVALMAGSGWTGALKNLYGDSVCIEDLWKRFFCITSNFTMRKMEVLKSGLLYLAIRASVSLPGILPPITNAQNELLIDGGIFNNLPVDVMRELAAPCKIVAIRVAPFTEIHTHLPSGILSGFKHYYSKLRSGLNLSAEMPNLAEIVIGSMTLCNDEHEMRMLDEADYVLEINLNQFGMVEFDKLPELIDLGYKAAMEKFTQGSWRELVPKDSNNND